MLLGTADLVLTSLLRDDKRNVGTFARQLSVDEKLRSPGHRVLLSVIVLGEALTMAAKRIYESQPQQYKPGFVSLAPTLLCQRLKSAGWCPWQIERLEYDTRMICTTLYTLSMVDQHRLQKDHSKCSVEKCYGYDVDYDTYRSKHVSPWCDCKFLPSKNSSVSLCFVDP